MSKLNITDLEQDAKKQHEHQAANVSLDELKQYGVELEMAKIRADKLMAQLEEVNGAIRYLETEKLPDMLKQLGIKDFTLASGAKISLIDIISASITDENREPAHDWLRKHGHGDLIKNNVTVVFGKGEEDQAVFLMNTIREMAEDNELKFGELQRKEAVHPSTLKAFVKSQVAEGTEFPGELFKLYTGQAVKMTK